MVLKHTSEILMFCPLIIGWGQWVKKLKCCIWLGCCISNKSLKDYMYHKYKFCLSKKNLIGVNKCKILKFIDSGVVSKYTLKKTMIKTLTIAFDRAKKKWLWKVSLLFVEKKVLTCKLQSSTDPSHNLTNRWLLTDWSLTDLWPVTGEWSDCSFVM